MCCSLINLMPTRPSMKGTYFQMLTVVICFHMEQKKNKNKTFNSHSIDNNMCYIRTVITGDMKSCSIILCKESFHLCCDVQCGRYQRSLRRLVS